MSTKNNPVIGISAGWMHEDDNRQRYNGRPLLFLEQSMARWLMSSGGGVPMMIPGVRPGAEVSVSPSDFADTIDGLVLQGGVDVAPSSYGEQPLRPEWSGDPIRDRYELDLIEACLDRDRPILAVCRGHQLLNVALGGTLYQDIGTQIDGALNHRDSAVYHELTHRVVLESGAELRTLYGTAEGMVNSVHHQAIKDVADSLQVEARCPGDGVVEAVRHRGSEYAVGVQWHPEFQEPEQHELLPTQVLLEDLLDAIRQRRR